MPKMYFPGESVGRDGLNGPSPGNPASYPITGRRRIATLSKGGGVIYDFTVITSGRVIGSNTRFIDTRS